MRDQTRADGSTLWLGIALVLSLVLNTFFIGLIVGGRLTSDRWADRIRDRLGIEEGMERGGFHGMGPALDPRHLGRMLPESAQDDVRAMMEARGPEIRGLFDEAGAARIAVFDAMRADPFDRAALDSAFAASRDADNAATSAVHDLTADILAGLSPEERAAIGAEVGERFPEMHDRRGRHERREHWRNRREERRDPPPTQTP